MMKEQSPVALTNTIFARGRCLLGGTRCILEIQCPLLPLSLHFYPSLPTFIFFTLCQHEAGYFTCHFQSGLQNRLWRKGLINSSYQFISGLFCWLTPVSSLLSSPNLHFDGISQGCYQPPILSSRPGATGAVGNSRVETAHYRTDHIQNSSQCGAALRFQVQVADLRGGTLETLRPSKTIRPLGPSSLMIAHLPDRPKQPHLTYPDISWHIIRNWN